MRVEYLQYCVLLGLQLGRSTRRQLDNRSKFSDRSRWWFTFTSVTAGFNSTCALRASGAAYCWGNNNQQQLGDNTYTPSSVPVAVLGGFTFSSITAGYFSACGIVSSGVGYCWGHNGYGQLGTADNFNYPTPTAIVGGFHWLKLVGSGSGPYACGVTNGAGVQCWGYGADGAIGNNATANVNTPTTVWLYVSSSSQTVAAIVDPSFLFSVAGRGTVCNGQSGTGFQTGATGTAVGLGHVSAAAVSGGAQDLTVSTNAANGFIVYLRTPGTTPNSLRDGASHTIADVAGTNASPGAAPVAGTAGFGYTSSDASTPFTSNTWAKLTNTNSSVLIGSAGTSSKSACMGYEVAVATTTAAATYSTTVIYTAVPTF